MSARNWFVSAVKIAAQAFPLTSPLSQWLDEIETSRIVGRLDRLEDPLSNYGNRAKDLTKILYSLIQAQPQDIPSSHLDWDCQLEPLKKEMRHFEAAGFLTGAHSIGSGGEFSHGFRLSPGFMVLLTVLHGDRAEISKLVETIENTKTDLRGVKLRETINLPITAIDAFFTKYEEQGQGFKSKEVGSSTYIPKDRVG
jgi:hypothetical protein